MKPNSVFYLIKKHDLRFNDVVELFSRNQIKITFASVLSPSEMSLFTDKLNDLKKGVFRVEEKKPIFPKLPENIDKSENPKLDYRRPKLPELEESKTEIKFQKNTTKKTENEAGIIPTISNFEQILIPNPEISAIDYIKTTNSTLNKFDPKKFKEFVESQYLRAYEIYTGSMSLIEKARELRIVYEEVVTKYLNTEGVPFSNSDLYYNFFNSLPQSKVKEDAQILKRKLNYWHHPYKGQPNENDVTGYFQSTIHVLPAITGIKIPKSIEVYLDSLERNFYIKPLNFHQKAAVLESKPIIFVNAGPGTGKTHLISYKFKSVVSG